MHELPADGVEKRRFIGLREFPFRGMTKSEVTTHTPVDLRGDIPGFVHIPDGKPADVKAFDVLVLQPEEWSALRALDVDDGDAGCLRRELARLTRERAPRLRRFQSFR